MSTTYIVVTLLAAALVAFSAGSLLLHARWVVQPLAAYGVPRSWWPWLGTAKAAGAPPPGAPGPCRRAASQRSSGCRSASSKEGS